MRLGQKVVGNLPGNRCWPAWGAQWPCLSRKPWSGDGVVVVQVEVRKLEGKKPLTAHGLVLAPQPANHRRDYYTRFVLD